jgi:hypothetical protein
LEIVQVQEVLPVGEECGADEQVECVEVGGQHHIRITRIETEELPHVEHDRRNGTGGGERQYVGLGKPPLAA